MSDAQNPNDPPDAGTAAHGFFVVQELLGTPALARIYTDVLINSPTTITAVRDRQGVSKSTAYKYANTLAELGVAEELDAHKDGSSLWRAEPVSGIWTDETTIELGPVIIAVFGATSVDDDLELFIERHGKAALAPAITATVDYLNGETTRRGVAAALEVPAVEGIAVSQAIERIIAVVKPHDSTLDTSMFEVDVHDRAIEQGPYQRANE
ncbi:helix-turn-helix domain-containing protein [Halocatena marina]|uniref:helix-turn-helix domain-containing protein n=1 Tax=Halocatena marina TaxID=2934937 RepID=UPI00200E1689|nr:helix-turn-helix domain-containing protein [Halocatena marina]